eukprot:5242506-Amphidinium_carterae.2
MAARTAATCSSVSHEKLDRLDWSRWCTRAGKSQRFRSTQPRMSHCASQSDLLRAHVPQQGA